MKIYNIIDFMINKACFSQRTMYFAIIYSIFFNKKNPLWNIWAGSERYSDPSSPDSSLDRGSSLVGARVCGPAWPIWTERNSNVSLCKGLNIKQHFVQWIAAYTPYKVGSISLAGKTANSSRNGAVPIRYHGGVSTWAQHIS